MVPNIHAIVLSDNVDSLSKFSICLSSGRKFGYDIEMFPAISREYSADVFFSKNIRIDFFSLRDIFAQLGCFASHFLLWERCVESNEPVVILEEDAIFKSPISDEVFNNTLDVCNIGQPSWKDKKFRLEALEMNRYSDLPKIHRLNYGHLLGSHAYFITPAGAKKLLKAASVYGARSVDEFVNSYYITTLQDFVPWPIFSPHDLKSSTIEARGSKLHRELQIRFYKKLRRISW